MCTHASTWCCVIRPPVLLYMETLIACTVNLDTLFGLAAPNWLWTRYDSILSILTCRLFTEIIAMLELRPSCENCSKQLPPDSVEALICSFECTFCQSCVADIFENVCPNCGGGFCPRPVRPARNWRNNNFLGQFPAGTTIRHNPVDPEVHRSFAKHLKMLPPEQR